MRIGVLAAEESWYLRDLQRAAALRGDTCTRLDFTELIGAVVSRGTTAPRCSVPPPDLRAGSRKRVETVCQTGLTGQLHELFDVVLVRTMPPGSLEQVVFRMDVLQRLSASGVLVVNSARALECAVDKYLTTSRLMAAGLPVPDTITCESEAAALQAFEELGGDVVVKPLFGSEGRGILRVSDPDLAARTFRTLSRIGAVLYLQRYIEHGGSDLRLLVLDGQIVGCMRRTSTGDFRTNVARGAIAQPYEPTEREVQLALAAAQATGSFIAGVDLMYDLQTNDCLVIEVNAVPGWQALTRVTGIDVALALLAACGRTLSELSRPHTSSHHHPQLGS